MNIKIKLIKNGKLPEYKTDGSAGADCFARLQGRLIIRPKEVCTIPLGFAVEVPDGYEMQIRGRSGLARNNCVEVFNSPATIDSDYRGEVHAFLFNNSDDEFIVYPNDRIAQSVIVPIIKAEWNLVDKLSETKRGENGFGSTGVSENKQIEISYPHKVEKFYEPFREIRKLEQLLGEEVVIYKQYKAIFSRVVQSGFNTQLYFKIVDVLYGKYFDPKMINHEVEMNIVSAFEHVRIDGHRFGQEIEFE